MGISMFLLYFIFIAIDLLRNSVSVFFCFGMEWKFVCVDVSLTNDFHLASRIFLSLFFFFLSLYSGCDHRRLVNETRSRRTECVHYYQLPRWKKRTRTHTHTQTQYTRKLRRQQQQRQRRR